jgi:hypothetical protein
MTGTRPILAALGISLLGYLASAMFVTLEYETIYLLTGMCAASVRRIAPVVTVSNLDMMAIGGLAIGFFMVLKLFVMWYV